MFVHILAARPNFIKANPLIQELSSRGYKNIIIHTNQHYDYKMSKIFFDELNIPEPHYHLEVGSGTHANQTADALIKIEEKLIELKPKYVVVYGDVNSSLSGAIAASKLNIPIIHVESGCRSYDDTMPEEINRKVIDSISTLLTCTEESAANVLNDSGIKNYVIAGNTAIDSLYSLISKPSSLDFPYYLCTLHRPFNVDDKLKLDKILTKLNKFPSPVIIPAHPRLKKNITKEYDNIVFIEPLGYSEFISYIKNSIGVISDSGGVQCEAAFFKVPLLTLRPSTEHLITLQYGNKLINVDQLEESSFEKDFKNDTPKIWDGNASSRIVNFILEYDSRNS